MDNIFETIFGRENWGQRCAILGSEKGTYGKLIQDSEKLAKYIKTLSCKKKEVIAICFPVSRNYVVSILATYLIDGIVVPLNPYSTLDEISYVLENSGATIFLTDINFEKKKNFFNHGEEVVYENIRAIRISNNKFNFSEETDRFIIYTSGSTSKPKGAVLSDQSISNNVVAIADNLALSSGDRTIVFTPPAYTYAISQILTHLWVGASVFLWEHGMMYPHQILKNISQYNLTGFAANPTLMKMFLSLKIKESLNSVRYVKSAGQPLYSDVAQKVSQVFPNARIVCTYGCTENSPRIAHFWLPSEVPARNTSWSVGRVLPGTEIKIVTKNGDPTSLGEVGEIFIKGKSLMSRYWGAPEMTRERKIDGWFRTCDLGFFDENELLNVVGRVDNVFSVGHEKVSPEEIEAVIEKLEAVVEVAVGSIKDKLLDHIPVALIVCREKGSNDLEKQVNNLCRERLSSAKIPKKICLVNEIPKTPYGKIDRRGVKELIESLVISDVKKMVEVNVKC